MIKSGYFFVTADRQNKDGHENRCVVGTEEKNKSVQELRKPIFKWFNIYVY